MCARSATRAPTLQNVVTYDAVIDVANSDLRLRPGMTANVTFTYAEADDASLVPNAALRFHPAETTPAAAKKRAPSARRWKGSLRARAASPRASPSRRASPTAR